MRLQEYTLPPIPRITASDLIRIRGELGITQTALAKALGVALRTVQTWESGPVAHWVGLALPGAMRRLREAERMRRARARHRAEVRARYQRLRAQAKELAERGVTDPDAFW